MKITPPKETEYPAYFKTYISKLTGDDLLLMLKDGSNNLLALFSNMPQEKLIYSYAAGKWTPKDILVHLMDAERVFAYRALRFAREDKTNLHSFEENDYAITARATVRDIRNLLEEYKAVREATIQLFSNFDEKALTQTGTANNNIISVRALGYCIAGHELHHTGVIRERYLRG